MSYIFCRRIVRMIGLAAIASSFSACLVAEHGHHGPHRDWDDPRWERRHDRWDDHRRHGGRRHWHHDRH
jgi:hypothetical protein